MYNIYDSETNICIIIFAINRLYKRVCRGKHVSKIGACNFLITCLFLLEPWIRREYRQNKWLIYLALIIMEEVLKLQFCWVQTRDTKMSRSDVQGKRTCGQNFRGIFHVSYVSRTPLCIYLVHKFSQKEKKEIITEYIDVQSKVHIMKGSWVKCRNKYDWMQINR